MADHYSIVSHPTNTRVLLVTENDAWALPGHETDDTEAIRAEMRQRYGLEVTALGVYAGHFTDAEREDPVYIFALDTRGNVSPLPTNARWVSHAELAALRLADDEQRQALERWFAEAGGGNIPAERAPWERRGWFDAAAHWIEEQIARRGWRRTGPYVQLHARGWSTVWRVPTSAKTLYFKAVTDQFDFETPLTTLLAELLPTQTAPVVASDNDRHWLLLEDAGEPIRRHIRETHDPELYQRVLVEFAPFQQALIPHMDRLVTTGCPDRRLATLPAQFAEVMRDADGLLVGRPGGLTSDDYAQLQTVNVADLVARLADFGIPETLAQEDCHPGHCIAGPDGMIYFDWGDTSLGHPFYSLVMALRWARLVLGYDAETLDGLRDAYLAQWGDYGSLERLREAYQLAWRLGPLVRGLSWYALVTHQEPSARWQHEDYPPHWLRLFLHGEDTDG